MWPPIPSTVLPRRACAENLTSGCGRQAIRAQQQMTIGGIGIRTTASLRRCLKDDGYTFNRPEWHMGNRTRKWRQSMRIVTTTLAVLCASAFFSVSAFAQSPANANPVASGIRTAWDAAKRNLTRSDELMPEKDFGFRLVDTVRTFGQILAHVAGANYVFCSAAKGEKSPHAEDAFEKNATTRAQIIKALSDSIAYCDSAYTTLDDKIGRASCRERV